MFIFKVKVTILSTISMCKIKVTEEKKHKELV